MSKLTVATKPKTKSSKDAEPEKVKTSKRALEEEAESTDSDVPLKVKKTKKVPEADATQCKKKVVEFSSEDEAVDTPVKTKSEAKPKTEVKAASKAEEVDKSQAWEKLSKCTQKALEAKGIKSLFPIQSACFDAVFQGNDVVGKAKTGTGKTLGFILPTVERLSKTTPKSSIPRAIILTPTRELARQIQQESESICQANKLKCMVMYGGTPFGPQCQQVRDGVDIIVSTPGRLQDHINRETVSMKNVEIVTLDEADEMLNMGFQVGNLRKLN
jgi:ATP-dependent RNA helicase DDX21